MKLRLRRRTENPWKAFVLGLAGGAAGTFVMSYYWQAVAKVTGEDPRKAKVAEKENPPLEDVAIAGKKYREGEPSTVTVGRMAYTQVSGKEPQTSEAKQLLSKSVHWTYGTVQGGLMGVLQARTRAADVPVATLYGTAMWLISALGLPVAGIAKGPGNYPPRQHVHSLFAHWIYALTATEVRKVLSRMFSVL